MFFDQKDEDTGVRVDDRPVVQLSPEMWRDLGNPEAVTIALWPGDRQDIMESDLNEALERVKRVLKGAHFAHRMPAKAEALEQAANAVWEAITGSEKA